MNKIFTLFTLLFLLGCNGEPPSKAEERVVFVPVANQFQAVWDEVSSDELISLPQQSVSYSKLFDGAIDLISLNAKRTLESQDDIIEYFDKLAHPNGICLRGVWEIDTPNPYGGLFKNASQALIIARASTALSETKRGETRAFGMAGKIFPTMDALKINTVATANFFVIDDLGGTDAPYYTDVALTNEPDVSFTSSIFSSFAYGLKVASAFSNADKNSGIRQLYELSFMQESNQTKVITPKWMKIEAQENQRRAGVEDFREEFYLEGDEKLLFNIFVASKEINAQKEWQKIGTITFNSSVVSTTCDHRLHFHHPLWRDDLVYE